MYNFAVTTIKPNIGKIIYKDFRQISMADLPGLIEGAHVNKGMGHNFLRHVERTKLLLLVVDINGFQLSPNYPHRTAMETVLLLNKVSYAISVCLGFLKWFFRNWNCIMRNYLVSLLCFLSIKLILKVL